MSSGYWGLLYDALACDPSESLLALGLVGKDLAFLDQGEVIYRSTGVSRQLTDLLARLGRGEQGKADLIREIWGI